MNTCVQLAPHPRSASEARRFARKLLAQWQEDAAADLVELLVSELVTNAVLHAGTPVDLSLHRSGGRLRVEVRDASAAAPAPRHATSTATLGRGLELVESLATAWGVLPHDPGKVVWFEVAAAQPAPAGEPMATGGADHAADNDEGVAIHLRDVPVMLFQAMEDHTGALLRENTLVRMGEDGAWLHPAVSIDFTHVVARLREAAQAGASQADVVLMVPGDAAESVARLVDELGEADALAEANRLLVGAALPEVLACRHWFLGEILGQLSGLAPSPWAPTMDTSTTSAGRVDHQAVVDTLGTAVVVADDKNHIAYANPAAESLLGWEPGALAGQRLTAIIPVRLHEAHVAGYSRFLVTREPRILGQTVRVPARRRDDSEVEVELTLAHRAGDGGRAMFVASLQAAPDAHASPVSADDLLGSIASLLVETPLSAVRRAVLACIGENVPAQFVAWWRLEGEHLVFSEAWSPTPADYEEFTAASAQLRMPRGVGLPGTALAVGEAVWLTDVVAGANFPRAAFALETGLRTGAAFPVLQGGRVVAVLEFFIATVTAPPPGVTATLDKVGRLLGMYLGDAATVEVSAADTG